MRKNNAAEIARILEDYGLDPLEMPRLEAGLLDYARSHEGIEISFADLSRLDGNAALLQSCVSDGKEIVLHSDVVAVGGPAARCYDIVHLALGHYYQWSAPKGSRLRFRGEAAWRLARGDFFGASADALREAADYEMEAHRISVYHLARALETAPQHKILLQFFTDWMMADLAFLSEYYAGNSMSLLFERWRKGTSIRPRKVSGTLRPVRRGDWCRPVIRPASPKNDNG